MNRTTSFLAGLALFGSAWAALATALVLAPFSGPARVIDGDTIQIGPTHVRLWGVDAFEHNQTCQQPSGNYACGRAATLAMNELVHNQTVHCTEKAIDRYKRTVAQCFVGTTDLGKAMVMRGWAFDYTQYSHGFYKDVENAAHEAGTGAWAGTFQWPWDFRHSRAK